MTSRATSLSVCKCCFISQVPLFASPTGTTSRSVVPLPKPEPGGTHVRLPVVPNALHRQIPPVHGFSHHRPAALRGNVSALVILITWGEGFSLHCPDSSKAMLNCLETGNQLKVDRKAVTRGQEKGIRGEGWMSTKTAENSSSKNAWLHCCDVENAQK